MTKINDIKSKYEYASLNRKIIRYNGKQEVSQIMIDKC
jgi:hypothetical protein